MNEPRENRSRLADREQRGVVGTRDASLEVPRGF
jgi:hypothetical protein